MVVIVIKYENKYINGFNASFTLRGNRSWYSGDSNKKLGGHGWGRGHGNGKSFGFASRDVYKGQSSGGQAPNNNQWKRYAKHGHWARVVVTSQRARTTLQKLKNAQSSCCLYMALVIVFPNTPLSLRAVATLSLSKCRPIQLWHLDSWPINYMTGCWHTFIRIDTVIHNTVKFGDGSESQSKDLAPCYSKARPVITFHSWDDHIIYSLHRFAYVKFNIIRIFILCFCVIY